MCCYLISILIFSFEVDNSEFEDVKEKIINKFEKILNAKNYQRRDEIYDDGGYLYLFNDECRVELTYLGNNSNGVTTLNLTIEKTN